jgi:hypothetical protein
MKSQRGRDLKSGQDQHIVPNPPEIIQSLLFIGLDTP